MALMLAKGTVVGVMKEEGLDQEMSSFEDD